MSDDAKKTEDEIAALRAEIADLKSALAGKEDKPKPKKEFVPPPYQRYDPTERMSMPRSAIEAMIAAEPRGFMSGVVRDNRAPTGPSSAVPRSEQPTDVRAPQPSSTPGWVEPTPLGPPPGIDLIDRAV